MIKVRLLAIYWKIYVIRKRIVRINIRIKRLLAIMLEMLLKINLLKRYWFPNMYNFLKMGVKNRVKWVMQ